MNSTIGQLAFIAFTCVLAQTSLAAERPLTLRPTESACFERTYNADHLRKHPKQTVRWIRVEHAKSSSEPNYAVIKAKFFGDPHLYSNGGVCSTEEKTGKLVCGIDCDGGAYTLSERDDGKIALRPIDRISVTACGGDDDDDDRPNRQILESDDQDAFVLERTPTSKCMLKPID